MMDTCAYRATVLLGAVCLMWGGCAGDLCKPDKTCADYPLRWGENYFDDGCGGKLPECTCPEGYDALPDHTCCKGDVACPVDPERCGGFTVVNPCTQKEILCTCSRDDAVCNTETQTCEAPSTCDDLGAGGTAQTCHDDEFFDRGDGVMIACPCDRGWHCIGSTSTLAGHCCENTYKCPDLGKPGSCNVSVRNSCTDGLTTCKCQTEGWHCELTTCVEDRECKDFGANGVLGNPCSNDPTPSFHSGLPDGNLTCPCNTGLRCVDSEDARVSGETTGTCKPVATCEYYRQKIAPDICSNGPSPDLPTDGPNDPLLTCKCGPGMDCAVGTTIVTGGQTGRCQPLWTCEQEHSATGKVGSICHDDPFFSDGFGRKIACPCDNGAPFQDNKCVDATPDRAGKCKCTRRTCDCTVSGTGDGCGGTLNCPCKTDEVCNKTTKACCSRPTCSKLGIDGDVGDRCEKVPLGGARPECQGMTIDCPCKTDGGWFKNKCGKSDYCECKPEKCSSGRLNVGCGSKFLTC